MNATRWRQTGRTLVIAHRGASAAAPENTLAAFRLAAAQGADGIEFDVRATADGGLVVIHDATLERTTDRAGRVDALTLEEVRRADAGARWSGAFAGERIPTLDEVLALARGRLLVDIELKVGGVEPQVVEAVARAGMTEEALLTSFLEDALVRVRSMGAGPAVGLLQQWAEPERAVALGVDVYLPHVGALSAEIVGPLRARGVAVIPWTVRSEDDARAALGLGVDGFIADDPAMARAVIAAQQR